MSVHPSHFTIDFALIKRFTIDVSPSVRNRSLADQKAEMAASHFLQVQVKSQVISLQVQVKSQVISLQVQVKSHIILSSCNTQTGPGIKSIYSELQSKIYEMVNGIK